MRVIRAAMMVLVIMLASVVSTGASSAQTAPVGQVKRHCFIDPTAETTCYATAAEVDDYAADRGMPSFLLVVFFDGFNFTGDSTSFEGPDYCTVQMTDIDYEDPRFWFNNRTSSVRTHGYCDVRFFDYYDPRRPDNPRSDWIDQDGNLATPGVNWSNRASAWQLS